MKSFMDNDFLLGTGTARRLFHNYAERLPLIDYHCHIDPREIYEDRRFNDLAEVWLGGRQPDGGCSGDHYKWRLMRSNGVSEDYITGSKPGYDKFLKFTETLEMAVGNPMVHWCNLELRRFFGCDLPLTSGSAPEIWEHCCEQLRTSPDLTVRGIIKKAGAVFIGTTDDPTDSLEWHKKIAEDDSFGTQVCPSFRPDKAININKPGFADYIAKLAESAGKSTLGSAREVMDALVQRLEYFAKAGCRASDHGLDYVPFRPASYDRVNAAFLKAMSGEPVSPEETEEYQTAVLLRLGREYSRLGIVMQLHYSCLRNANARMYKLLGPDTGFDMIARNTCGGSIAALLSALDETDECPKTILYSLDPSDNRQLGSLIGCFQSDELPGKIQHGSAWWFNDTRSGIEDQLRSLAELGLLGNFVGMLTDSRSFLSYARHEYFRRILCNMIGEWVENGEYPDSEVSLKKIVEGVCFKNAERYFELDR